MNAKEIALAAKAERGLLSEEEKKRQAEIKESVAGQLFAAVSELAGEHTLSGNRRGEVEVSRTGSAAIVAIREMLPVIVNRSRFGLPAETRWRKGKETIGGWMLGGSASGFWVRDGAGPPQEFSEISDAIAHVARAVGRIMEDLPLGE